MLDTWFINEELLTRSDHELVVYDLRISDETVGGIGTAYKVTG